MNDKTVLMTVFFVVLLVGIVGFVGLTKELTGQTYRATQSLPSRGCVCEIEVYDTQGNVIDYQTQTIRVKTAGGHTDDACMNRCEMLHGRSKSGRKKVVHAYSAR